MTDEEINERIAELTDEGRVELAVATQHGATIDRTEAGKYYPRGIRLTFALHGADAHISLDGDSRLQSVSLISWCANGGAGNCFSHNFEVCASAFRGVGTPQHKATSCPQTVADLVNDLDGGLGSIAGGSAFRFYIHPWAANTAWVGAGSPTDRPKEQWIEEYRRTGVRPSESPAIHAAREAFQAAGGDSNWKAATAAADLAYRAAAG